MRKLTLAAIGLGMLAIGPATALVAPDAARADPPPSCEQVCDIVYIYQQNQCHARLPPLPSQDDQYEYALCMIEADINHSECNNACPP